VGTVGNSEHMLQKSGKAGRSRWQGRRPRTRAVAMNPVDHPMGGGEGRASGGHPRSRKGLLAKGKKTRHPEAHRSSKFIIERATQQQGACIGSDSQSATEANEPSTQETAVRPLQAGEARGPTCRSPARRPY
jgi:hypothetical protein